MFYINMDKKLLRKGGRTAVTMSERDFEALFTEALLRFMDEDEEEEAYPCGETEEDPTGYGKLLYNYCTLYQGEQPFKKAFQDIGKIEVSFENAYLEKFVKGSNGVPAAQCIFCGDWEVPVLAYIYWDGKDFRGYVPVYGNSYNRYCRCAFGSEDPERGAIYGKKYCVMATEPDTDLFQDGSKKVSAVGEPETVLLTEQTFNSFNWKDIEYNEAACLEDFSSRVVSAGPADAGKYNDFFTSLCRLRKRKPREGLAEIETARKITAKKNKIRMRAESHDWGFSPDKIYCKGMAPNYMMSYDGKYVTVFPAEDNGAELDDEAFVQAFPDMTAVDTHKFLYTGHYLSWIDAVLQFPNLAAFLPMFSVLEMILLSTDEFRLGFSFEEGRKFLNCLKEDLALKEEP